MIPPPIIDASWTLFLDRDGVINIEKKDDYILSASEFMFYPQVPQALAMLSPLFGTIVMVTNQRGVGKQLMTEYDLQEIHKKMMQGIEAYGGRIDKIYYCTSTENSHPNRKPNPGMAWLAKNDFQNINLSKSIIIGNKLSDMQFGRNAGISTLYVATTNPEVTLPHPLIDYRFDHLPAAAAWLSRQ